MTPYWTGSTPKRRSAPVSEGPSGALGATESVEGAVPGIPGSVEGTQGHSGPRGGEPRYTLREARQKLREDECRNGGHAPGHHLVRMDGTPSSAYCDCGLYRYEPVRNP